MASRSKSEWLRALDTAIHHSHDTLPYQALVSASRKQEHAEEEARETAERIRRDSQADIIENTQAELKAEKMVTRDLCTIGYTVQNYKINLIKITISKITNYSVLFISVI